MSWVFVKTMDVTKPEDNCSGCRVCEIVCSITHEGACNPRKSRIRVSSKPGVDYPNVCRQCRVPRCAEACPTGAIAKDKKIGAYIVDNEKCTACHACVASCPFGAITIHPNSGFPIKCDLCGGSPQCVKYCPQNVLEYLPKKKD
jgi:Fe-S-cluster-containing hydrogenase component 2